MLNKDNILSILEDLNLPKGHYAVNTSSVLVLNGLKDYANDIDIDCDIELFNLFLDKGYISKFHKGPNDYCSEIIDLTESIQLIKKEVLISEDIVDYHGFDIYTLEYVRRFKAFLGREKDLKDIDFIDNWNKVKEV